MPIVRRPRAIAAATVLVLCACGSDATRPRLDPQAAHYDSLAAVAAASGDFARDGALSMVALAYQGGITPGTVTVQDSGAATVYRAVVVRDVLSGSPPFPGAEAMPDMWSLVLWQEPDGARFIHVTGQTDSVSFGAGDGGSSILHFGQVDWGADGRRKHSADGYALLAMGDPSGSCALATATMTCTRATFTVSLAAVVKPLLGATSLVDFDAAPHPIAATSLVVPGLSMARR
jgi:hypothetical protein